MTNVKKKRESGCPVAYGLDIFGDRWSLLIIREILLKKKMTYGEFGEIDEGIATNVLAERLKRLESEGVIIKSRDLENRRRFIYELTDKGLDLAPVLIEIILWSGQYDSRTSALKDTWNEIRKNRPAFERKIGIRRRHAKN
jgi:DNA-binding HxlR family transcriptional regulator